MYCGNCGQLVSENDFFCSNCGNKLIDEVRNIIPNYECIDLDETVLFNPSQLKEEVSESIPNIVDSYKSEKNHDYIENIKRSSNAAKRLNLYNKIEKSAGHIDLENAIRSKYNFRLKETFFNKIKRKVPQKANNNINYGASKQESQKGVYIGIIILGIVLGIILGLVIVKPWVKNDNQNEEISQGIILQQQIKEK